MLRKRMMYLACAAGLGALSGCGSWMPGSFLYRLTHPFSRVESCPPAAALPPSAGFASFETAPVCEGGFVGGPVIVDPGSLGGMPACPTPAMPSALPAAPLPAAPLPGALPETAPPPRLYTPGELQKMPYQQ